MERKIKALQERKNIFENLKADHKSALFSEDKINNKLSKKLEKSCYVRDKQLLKLNNLLEDDIDQINDNEIPMSVDYVEKEKSIGLRCIVLMVPFNSYMLMLPTWNFWKNPLVSLIMLS